MQQLSGDIFNYVGKPGVVVCITTNGTVKRNGHAVMGRGNAYQYKTRYPMDALVLGRLILKGGNKVHQIRPGIWSFPVKTNWWDKADIGLIKRSCLELMDKVNKYPGAIKGKHPIVILPRPGCGNGGLKWNQVLPEIEGLLDDRIWVIEYEQ